MISMTHTFLTSMVLAIIYSFITLSIVCVRWISKKQIRNPHCVPRACIEPSETYVMERFKKMVNG